MAASLSVAPEPSIADGSKTGRGGLLAATLASPRGQRLPSPCKEWPPSAPCTVLLPPLPAGAESEDGVPTDTAALVAASKGVIFGDVLRGGDVLRNMAPLVRETSPRWRTSPPPGLSASAPHAFHVFEQQ